MNNPRVYEVAKDIGMSSQELMDRLREDGYSIKNNFNAVNPKLLDFIMSNYVGDKKKQPKKKRDPRSGITVEETSSDLKPKEFVVRYVPKKKKKEEPLVSKKTEEPKKQDKIVEPPKEEKTPDKKQDSNEPRFVRVKKAKESSEPKAKESTKPATEPKKSPERPKQEVKKPEQKPEPKREGRSETSSERQSSSKKKRRDEAKHHGDSRLSVNKHHRGRMSDSDTRDFGDSEGSKFKGNKKKNKSEKKKSSKYEDGGNLGSSKSSSKKKKSKSRRARNIIDESMRSELEKTDLNFAKKTPNKRKKKSKRLEQIETEAEIVEVQESASIIVKERVMVHEFADIIGVPTNEVILKLMNLGVMASINQYIDFDVMEIIAEEYGVELQQEEEKIDTAILDYDFEDKEEDLEFRAPVVTVMGHVDHGKTSLLDAIRSTSVTEKEAGGITQHIGASEVKINGQKIVFLDTPGHEAFTSLRARGVQLTDIAILVVAADDGVMPQTIEAIDHARAADVPLIVAINKIDKPGANPDQVIKELSEHGVLVEDWGGDTVSVKVSAKKNENIDSLLEMVLLVAEMMDLKANPKRSAVGTVIEANLEKGRGSVATVLVQKGTLKVTDPFVCGTTYGRVRALYNHRGKKVKQAGPSTAVEVIGMSEVPMAGDRFFAVNSDKEARKIAENRAIEQRAEEMAGSSQKVTLEDLFDQIQAGNLKTLNLIIKADVHGSIEAIKQSLSKLKSDEVKINIQHANIGTITESDIMLATASNTIILGFNVRPSAAVIDLAAKENVEIKTYRVIYELINDVEAALTGMLAPKYVEKQLGEIEVRATFKVPNVGTIAGGYVTSGKVMRSSNVRLLRNGVIIFEGSLSSLKRFKDDVREVAQGYECGVGIEGFNDIKEGDTIEVYEIEEIKASL